MQRSNAESNSHAPRDPHNGRRGRSLVIGLIALAIVLGILGVVLRDVTLPPVRPTTQPAATQPAP